MNILIVAVGRMKDGPEATLMAAYLRRLTWQVDLREIDLRGKTSDADRKRLEGEKILAALPDDARVVALDERGRDLSSRELATCLENWRDQGQRRVAFVIGGADGLTDTVRQRADTVISFGRATWPHLLIRAMLAEQLYRAASILTGHPYHRA